LYKSYSIVQPSNVVYFTLKPAQ